MEKKLKFSEFAKLIGTTAKTVYKMEEREEIVTVTEKVNNRLTRLIVTDDDQIEHFKNVYRKSSVNNGNCEDMLTDNETTMNSNNSSQTNKNDVSIIEIFDKVLKLNEEYNDRISKLNEKLLTSERQILLLEDKAGREGLYLKEINELKTENEKLKNARKKLFTLFLTVIVVILLLFVGFFTYNIALNKVNNVPEELQEQKKVPVQQEVVQPAQKPVKQARR